MNAQKMIIALVIGVALVACSRQSPQSTTNSPQAIVRSSTDQHTPLVRDFDSEYGVVCYRVRYSEGISCIKVSEPKPNAGNSNFSAVNPTSTTEY